MSAVFRLYVLSDPQIGNGASFGCPPSILSDAQARAQPSTAAPVRLNQSQGVSKQARMRATGESFSVAPDALRAGPGVRRRFPPRRPQS